MRDPFCSLSPQTQQLLRWLLIRASLLLNGGASAQLPVVNWPVQAVTQEGGGVGSSTDQICFILKADQELSSLSIPDQAVTKCPSCKPRHNEQRTVLPYGYFFFFFFNRRSRKYKTTAPEKKNKIKWCIEKRPRSLHREGSEQNAHRRGRSACEEINMIRLKPKWLITGSNYRNWALREK